MTTDLDPTCYRDHVGIWARELQAWLPEKLFDAHVHLGLPGSMGGISEARRRLPLCTFTHLSFEQARGWHGRLFPAKRVAGIVAFPFPLQEVDIAGANRYIVEVMRAAPEIKGFLLAHPTDLRPSLGAWEDALCAGVRFHGVKPYFDLLGKSVFECSMDEFIPETLLQFMDAHRLVLMLHTSGTGMGDPANQQYLRRVLEGFPGVKIVLAHFGRYLEADQFFRFCDSGLLDYPALYLEMSSASVPAVYARVLQQRSVHRRLLFGTDLPFGLITGMEAWSERAGAIFVTRDTYAWTDEATQQASPLRPDALTYNTYHVIHAFKSAMAALGLAAAEESALKQAVFHDNAQSLLQSENQGERKSCP